MADGSVFKALADPTRREILDALFGREGQSLGELEQLFDMTRFGVMKHVKVLEEAGLVVTRKVGRSRLHYLNPVPIREIHDRWTGKFAARASEALLTLRAGLEKGGTMAANGKPSHVYVVYIRATPERIWDALTQSEFTQRYFYGSTVESDWTPGSAYVREINGETAILGEVLVADRPSRLSVTFDARWDDEVAPDPPSRVTWEIEPAGDGLSKLTVVHDGFDGETNTYRQAVGGMPYILSALKTLLETGEPMPAAA